MPDSEYDAVEFEVGRTDDETEWRLTVKCATGLTDEEFAAALLSLSDDIMKKRVSFDTAPDIDHSNLN